MTKNIMTMREVADFLRLTEKTAYRLASEGKIPGFKVGGSWRFRKEEIDTWIEDKIKNTAEKSDKTDKRDKAA
jgi:excisionase family DNA binding protein